MKEKILTDEEINTLLGEKKGDRSPLSFFSEPQLEQDIIQALFDEAFNIKVDVKCSDPTIVADPLISGGLGVVWEQDSPCQVFWTLKSGEEHIDEEFENVGLLLMVLTQAGQRWLDAYRGTEATPSSIEILQDGSVSGSWIVSEITLDLGANRKVEVVRYIEVIGESSEAGPTSDPKPQHAAANQPNIDILMDVEMAVTVVLGSTTMQVKDVLGLGKGRIVLLEKAAGEPVEIQIQGKTVARGEVVVQDEQFGVRIIDILDPNERLGG